jgi:meso-butanediol dehydrogenase / (S,S)-butanediol dehydrogenase / diacetyl reductase
MSDQLENRTVIVTGAGSGIGAGIAADLSAHGAKLVIADLNKSAAERVAADIRLKTGGAVMAIEVDVSNRQSVQSLIAKTVDTFVRLDVMFNNAGIIETASYLENYGGRLASAHERKRPRRPDGNSGGRQANDSPGRRR